MTQKAKILELLTIVAPILPAPIYWEDTNSVLIGANEHVFKAAGALRAEAYLGKTLFELYPQEMAKYIKEHNEEVMRTGKILSQEEVIRGITTGEIKYFTAIKAPLRDDEGNIIGVVGTSIDITAEKEAERLALENEIQRNLDLAQEQEKFMKIAHQVAHDIRSPLASLLMIVKSCTEIPEMDRVSLREAAVNIGDIANHLLSPYEKNQDASHLEAEESQPILISATLLQLLTDKKYQYQELPIKFDYDFLPDSQFAFIKIEPSDFKRMISNLVNNAVDSFENKDGVVTLRLEANSRWVKISIEDNGKGMADDLIEKIRDNIAITSGKKKGHGIGLTQVRDTLQRNQGQIAIASKIGHGTQITLTFPRIATPNWIAEEITLAPNDCIVILDDDTSIHGAWETHFLPILKKYPSIKLRHFLNGEEAIQFIISLPNEEKKSVLLLTDYELLKQNLNGLEVIKRSNVHPLCASDSETKLR